VTLPPRRSLLLLAALAGCAGPPPFQVSATAPGSISVAGRPGPTPFIAYLDLSDPSLASVTSVAYTVQPRAGSLSKPVKVGFTVAALQRRGNVSETGLTVPVFGLYAGWVNQVTLELEASDGSSREVQVQITTPPYVDSEGVYDHATILQPRSPGGSLDFDFIALKSIRASVVVIDTDGAVRWVGTGIPSSATAFADNGFVVGSPSSKEVQRLELDGALTSSTLDDSVIVQFSHNIDPGKVGLLGEFDVNGDLDATVAEITPSGTVVERWELGDLLSRYMASQGDDPTAFVRPGQDWFHLNAATYDPSDDSLIVSSRENFLMKIDYATGDLIWLLGDPTKYWYTFPSLRAKALTLTERGFYPIGQHATSLTSDGLLMVFNDGTASTNQPAGAPAGQSRGFAVVSAYQIDSQRMTATEVWRYDHQPELDSDFCSSVYQAGQSLLVNYARASAGATVRVLGLDSNRQVVFDFAFANPNGCDTSWNAVPVPFDQLTFE
jgi:arylsulfate sulfotransferase